jgi:nucleotide-binding universal stress UspA family protein
MVCPVGTEIKVATAVDLFHPFTALPDVQLREYRKANELVQDAVKELSVAHPDAEISADILDGYATDAIIKLCRNWLADLLIVGSHGRRGLNRFFLGSVSRGLLLHAPCAVRIVRTAPEPTAESSRNNVLIALEQSEHSKHLLDHVLSFPWDENTRFTCIHVVPSLGPGLFLDDDTLEVENIVDSFNEVVRQHQEWINSVADVINSKYEQKVAHGQVLLGDPKERILEYAAEWPADLIMLGSHGKQSFEKLVLGSVSEGVAVNAHCATEVTKCKRLRKSGLYLIA